MLSEIRERLKYLMSLPHPEITSGKEEALHATSIVAVKYSLLLNGKMMGRTYATYSESMDQTIIPFSGKNKKFKNETSGIDSNSDPYSPQIGDIHFMWSNNPQSIEVLTQLAEVIARRHYVMEELMLDFDNPINNIAIQQLVMHEPNRYAITRERDLPTYQLLDEIFYRTDIGRSHFLKTIKDSWGYKGVLIGFDPQQCGFIPTEGDDTDDYRVNVLPNGLALHNITRFQILGDLDKKEIYLT